MEELVMLKGRINDLSLRARNNNYTVSSHFLSQSEQSEFFKSITLLKGNNYAVNGVNYFLYGGIEDSDRKMAFFLSEYETQEDILTHIEDYIEVYEIEPKNIHYAEDLTHRDYLGAFMNLGLEREIFGDIFIDGLNGYIFAVAGKEKDIMSLDKIKHTDVKITKRNIKELNLKRNFINP